MHRITEFIRSYSHQLAISVGLHMMLLIILWFSSVSNKTVVVQNDHDQVVEVAVLSADQLDKSVKLIQAKEQQALVKQELALAKAKKMRINEEKKAQVLKKQAQKMKNEYQKSERSAKLKLKELAKKAVDLDKQLTNKSSAEKKSPNKSNKS